MLILVTPGYLRRVDIGKNLPMVIYSITDMAGTQNRIGVDAIVIAVGRSPIGLARCSKDDTWLAEVAVLPATKQRFPTVSTAAVLARFNNCLTISTDQ